MTLNFIGMDIGDVDNDGKNEIVIIDMSNIMIYRKEGNSLKLFKKFPANRTINTFPWMWQISKVTVSNRL